MSWWIKSILTNSSFWKADWKFHNLTAIFPRIQSLIHDLSVWWNNRRYQIVKETNISKRKEGKNTVKKCHENVTTQFSVDLKLRNVNFRLFSIYFKSLSLAFWYVCLFFPFWMKLKLIKYYFSFFNHWFGMVRLCLVKISYKVTDCW